jgi:hypothetical protein
MSYFEDQMEAWEDSGFQGEPTDIDPYVFWADRMSECESRGHAKINWETIERDNGSKYKAKVCSFCKAIL